MKLVGATSPVKVSVADPAIADWFATNPTCAPDTFTVTAVVNAEKSTVLPGVASLKVAFPVPATNRFPVPAALKVSVPAPPMSVLLSRCSAVVPPWKVTGTVVAEPVPAPPPALIVTALSGAAVVVSLS